MTIELIVGEDRVLVLDLIEAVGGGPLAVTGWTMQLRLGVRADAQVTRPLVVDAAVAGRVACTLVPGDLAPLASGAVAFAVWRTDLGVSVLVAEGTARVRRVLIV